MIPKMALDAMHEGHFLPCLFEVLTYKTLPYCALYGPADYWQSWYRSLPEDKQQHFLPYHQPLKQSVSLEQLWERDYQFIFSTQNYDFLPSLWAAKEEPCALWHYDGQNVWFSSAIWPLELLSLEQWLQLYRLAHRLKHALFSSQSVSLTLGPVVSGSQAEHHFQLLVPDVMKDTTAGPAIILVEPLLYQQQLKFLTERTVTEKVKTWWGTPEKKPTWLAQGVCSAKTLLVAAKVQDQEALNQVLNWASLSCCNTTPR